MDSSFHRIWSKSHVLSQTDGISKKSNKHDFYAAMINLKFISHFNQTIKVRTKFPGLI